MAGTTTPVQAERDSSDRFYAFALPIAAIVISVASLYTTYLGMAGLLPWLVAGITAGALQIIVGISGWILGRQWARQEVKASITILFVLTVFVSFFFSYQGIYAEVNDETRLARRALTVARIEISTVNSELVRRSGDEQAASVRQAIDEPAYQSWRADLGDVADMVTRSEDALQEEFAQERTAREERAVAKAARLAKDEAEERRVTNSIAEFKSEAESLQQRVRALEPIVKPQQRSVAQLESRVAGFKRQMDLEETGSDGRTGGKGPAFHAARRQWEDAKRLVDAAQNNLAPNLAELQQAADRLTKIGHTITQLETVLARLQTSIDQAKSSETGTGTDAAQDFAGNELVAAMQAALTRFEAGGEGQDPLTVAGLRDAENLCSETVAELSRYEKLRSEAQQLNCKAIGVQPALQRLARSRASHEELLNECGNARRIEEIVRSSTDVAAETSKDSSQASSKESPRGSTEGAAVTGKDRIRAFNNVLDYGRSCIQIASGSLSDVSGLNAKIQDIENRWSTETTAFQRALTGLQSQDGVAYLMLLIALIIDAVVFFAGFLDQQRRNAAEVVRRIHDYVEHSDRNALRQMFHGAQSVRLPRRGERGSWWMRLARWLAGMSPHMDSDSPLFDAWDALGRPRQALIADGPDIPLLEAQQAVSQNYAADFAERGQRGFLLDRTFHQTASSLLSKQYRTDLDQATKDAQPIGPVSAATSAGSPDTSQVVPLRPTGGPAIPIVRPRGLTDEEWSNLMAGEVQVEPASRRKMRQPGRSEDQADNW